MSDIKLFRLDAGRAEELQGDSADLEKPLQTLIETNLDALLGLRFLATEYVQRKELKLYVAYTRLKNFASLVPKRGRLLLYLHLDPTRVPPPPGIGRDVSQQGHWGTGDIEISIASAADLDVAKPLIQQACERGGSAGPAPGAAS